MCPRVAKRDQGELPKPMVQPGTLGFYPVQNLGLSYLHQDLCDVVIGHKDLYETLYLKEHPVVWVEHDHQKVEYSLKGNLLNGFSDAFYRGRLPQVIVVTLGPGALQGFLDELLDHLEKMLSLGFFFQKPDPVELMVPCFVLAGNGFLYTQFIRALDTNLQHLQTLDKAVRPKILGKFLRGIFDDFRLTSFQKGVPIPAEHKRVLKLAGGNYNNQQMAQQVLKAHGLECPAEEVVDRPEERLELENALSRFSVDILPVMVQEGILVSAEMHLLESKVHQAIFEVGKALGAFTFSEKLEGLLAGLPKKHSLEPQLLPGDESLLPGLLHLSQLLELEEPKAVFLGLREKLAGVSLSTGALVAEKLENP